MATDTLTASEVDLDRPAVGTVRVLAMDAIQKAGSGHPGTARGAARPIEATAMPDNDQATSQPPHPFLAGGAATSR